MRILGRRVAGTRSDPAPLRAASRRCVAAGNASPSCAGPLFEIRCGTVHCSPGQKILEWEIRTGNWAADAGLFQDSPGLTSGLATSRYRPLLTDRRNIAVQQRCAGHCRKLDLGTNVCDILDRWHDRRGESEGLQDPPWPPRSGQCGQHTSRADRAAVEARCVSTVTRPLPCHLRLVA